MSVLLFFVVVLAVVSANCKWISVAKNIEHIPIIAEEDNKTVMYSTINGVSNNMDIITGLPAEDPPKDGSVLTLLHTSEILNLTLINNNFPMLTTLIVKSHVRFITGISPKISSLQVIDLSNNLLTSIPSSLGHLSSLKELNVSNNKIQDLQQVQLGALFEKLYVIDLSGNPLRCSRHHLWLRRMTSLHRPDLLTCADYLSDPFAGGHRQPLMPLLMAMEDVESECRHSGCKCTLQGLRPRQVIADCSRRGRSHLPAPKQLTSDVITLNVSANQIRQVAGRLCDLLTYSHQLTTVDLSGNQLETLAPDSLSCVGQLGLLDFRDNQLSSMPLRHLEEAFRGNLQTVLLSGNPWNCADHHEALLLQRFLLDHHLHVPDFREVRCGPDSPIGLAGSPVYRLFQSESGPRVVSARRVDLLDLLLMLETLLLLLLLVVFVYDWTVYRRTGRLPWVVTCWDGANKPGHGKHHCQKSSDC